MSRIAAIVLAAMAAMLALDARAAGGLPPDFAAALARAGVQPQQVSVWFGEATSTEARFH